MKLVEKCGNVLNPVILSIDFYTSDGTLAAGTYEACETGGTINVEISGDSCTIILESSNINARYVGAFAL